MKERKNRPKAGFNCRFCRIDLLLEELWRIQAEYPQLYENETIRHVHNQHHTRLMGPIEYCHTEMLRNLEWLARVCEVENEYERVIRYCNIGLDEIDPNNKRLRALKKKAMLAKNRAGKVK